MTRIRALYVSLSLLVAGFLAAGTAAPSGAAAAARGAAAAGPSPTAATAESLTRAFAAARHLPAAAVAGVRAGTLHVGTAAGKTWAISSFTPYANAGSQVTAGLQDGAGTGVFSQVNGAWRLVGTGPYGCADGLPASLKAAWGLGHQAACDAAPATERAAARRALAELPASAAAAAEAPGQSIAAIALGQVGAADTPVVTSFSGVDCDPYSTLVAGFSANSDGCGYDQGFNVQDENEAWCADFNKWVWQQAGVTADMNTLNAGSVSFYDWAKDQGETLAADTGTPAVGDSIVMFDPSLVGVYADHVGIVTSVHPDGTIDMVNGDFLASANVHVEYDTEISLTSWAASVWGPGEEWFIVTPPANAQQPVPAASMNGPHVTVAGTTGTFHAEAASHGGSITQYYWTFGDGRSTNTTGPDVTHVFPEDGTYTVTVTVTSSFGTIRTLTWNVHVLGVSSAVAAVPSDAVWFATTPVDEYMFTRSAGALAADTWDGASWLQVAVGGQPSAATNIAALSYPDAQAMDAMTPHAYYGAADGSLAQTYLSANGWVTQELPGRPAPGSAIVATTTPGGDPEVFYADATGHLAESAVQSGSWATSELLPGGPPVRPGSVALAATSQGPEIFAVNTEGTVIVVASDGGVWHGRGIPAQTSNDSLAAVTMPDGVASIVFTDSGALAMARQRTAGQWAVSDLPGTPAAATPLAATNYLLPNAHAVPLGTETFYLTTSGQPEVTFYDGQAWQTAALPPAAAGITGANAYQVAGLPSELFGTQSDGTAFEDTAADPSAAWTAATLPGKPATFADRVVLYAATPDDDASALAAAAAAGLGAGQVTRSFATAWDDTLSGGYLVLSVGQAATDALYYNVCGWANPSTDIPGSTPFYYVVGPVNHLPGASAFENAAAATASLTPQRAADLAYYAVHGTLPPGVTSVPSAARALFTCAGSAS